VANTSDPILTRWMNEQHRLERKIETAEATIQESKQRLDRISIAIEEYQKAMGQEPASAERRALDGVLGRLEALLRAHPQRSFNSQEAVDALMQDGWETTSTDPAGLVANRFSKLNKLGKAQRVGKGRYAVAAENSDGPTEVGPSEHLASDEEGGGYRAPPLDDR
jgi:hypothetical protein